MIGDPMDPEQPSQEGQDVAGSRQAGDHLGWRVGLFAAGAALGLGGIFLDSRLLIWVAIGILGAGFVLRFLPGR